MTADLVYRTWATVRDRPGAAASSPTLVMEALAAFQADPCASGWYGFVVRLGVLVHPREVHRLLGELDPFPGVTTIALADVQPARAAAPGLEVD